MTMPYAYSALVLGFALILSSSSCGLVQRCPLFPEEADCTHIRVEPTRIALSKDGLQPLAITFYEQSIVGELSLGPEVRISLRQGESAVPLDFVSSEGNQVLAAPPGAPESLRGGAAELLIEFDNGRGLRSASAPVLLFRPLRFRSTASVVQLPASIKPLRPLPRGVAILPNGASALSTAHRLAVRGDLSWLSEKESERVCFFRIEDLQLLGSLTKEQLKEHLEALCPIKTFGCSISADNKGCIIGLCRNGSPPDYKYLLAYGASSGCPDTKEAMPNFEEGDFLASDVASTVAAVATPNRADPPLVLFSTDDFARLSLQLPPGRPLAKVAKMGIGDFERIGITRPSVEVLLISEELQLTVLSQVASFYTVDSKASETLTELVRAALPPERVKVGDKTGYDLRKPMGLFAADMDQDGQVDLGLLTRSADGSNIKLHFFGTQGDGIFSAPQEIPLPAQIDKSYVNADVVVGDVDRDDRPDLVFLKAATGEMTIVHSRAN